jgi:hypothetical protein
MEKIKYKVGFCKTFGLNNIIYTIITDLFHIKLRD